MTKHFRRDNHVAMAARQGMFQIQRVTYNSDGISSVQPLTGWFDIDIARAEMQRITEHEEAGRIDVQIRRGNLCDGTDQY